MTVLRIVPTGDGRSHDVYHRGKYIGQAVKAFGAGEPPWTFQNASEADVSVGRWPTCSGAAVAMLAAKSAREGMR